MDDASALNGALLEFDVARIMELIPHRYPFLFIDKVVDIVPGERSVGIKNVTVNEPFFAGHFPGNPVMPGVLLIEAMAQTAGVTVMAAKESESSDQTPLVYFMTVDSARFRKPVVPGDVVKFHVEKLRARGPVWKFKGEATVDGVLKAESVFSAMIVERS